jgi:hypothetical protein
MTHGLWLWIREVRVMEQYIIPKHSITSEKFITLCEPSCRDGAGDMKSQSVSDSL